MIKKAIIELNEKKDLSYDMAKEVMEQIMRGEASQVQIAAYLTGLAFKKNGNVYIRSGAGIVADSVPENEYIECQNKAKAVVKALEYSTGGDF